MLTSSPNDAAGAQRPRPITQDEMSFELLDIGSKPIGRFPTLQMALEVIATWPRRTLFVVRRWQIVAGQMVVTKRWLICLGMDGQYRQTEINRHWTIGPTPGKD